jgi:hypothetical protein
MVEIPEDEKENYPDGKGGFYERKIDTDNPKIYEEFVNAMFYVNNELKKKTNKNEENT